MNLKNSLSALPSARRRWWLAGGVLVVALAALIWWRAGSSPAGGMGGMGAMGRNMPVPVRSATAQAEDMPFFLYGLGTVQPSGSVLVRSRVDGQLMKLRFSEGQRVQAGDILAEIDPRPFENALHEAQGQLAKDKALLENARRDLARYAQLSKGDYIAEQQVETQRSLVRQYEGVVRADEASVASAALQVEYSRIEAPLSGTLGLKQVDEGNMIRASDTNGLVRITQTRPSDVVFTLPEADLPELLNGQRQAQKDGQPLLVEAWDREQKHMLSSGYLLSIDNQIDTTTGTVKIKARFPNEDDALFPNQFVNARLRVRVQPGAVVIPSSAVQLGAQGSYVYVVDADGAAPAGEAAKPAMPGGKAGGAGAGGAGAKAAAKAGGDAKPVMPGRAQEYKVSLRKVTPGWRYEGRTVITQGVKAGEIVVVDGLDRLRDGATVMTAP